jgi:diguanylate cyclase (GGDEF)-like protein
MVDASSIALAISTASATLQTLAAVVAVRIVRISGRSPAWALVAGALTLMALRRVVPLWRVIGDGGHLTGFDLVSETISLTVSVILLSGMVLIHRAFRGAALGDGRAALGRVPEAALFPALNPSPVLRVDADGRVILANPAARSLGLIAGQVLTDVLTGMAPVDLPRIVRHGEHTTREGHTGTRVFHVVFRGVPERGFANVYTSEVTDLKVAEDVLRTTNEELRRWVGELERHRHDAEIHLELNALLQSCESVSEIGSVVERLGPALFPDSSGTLFLDHGDDSSLAGVGSWGVDPPPGTPFAADQCWAVRRGHLHVADGARASLVCAHLQDGFDGDSLCLPVRGHGGTPGLVTLRGSPRLRDAGGQRQARLMADAIGLAVVNLRLRDTLREQSIRDPLTGLFNRRYFEETLAREVARADRAAEPVSLLMVDLDHFKVVNDGYGHLAGDRVLRSAADLLSRHVRAADVVCRYGGDEFAVVLPDAGPDLALDRAEVLLRAAHAVELPGPEPTNGRLSLSVGVACFPRHARHPASLTRAADDAMYEAKRAGRNRVGLPAGAVDATVPLL